MSELIDAIINDVAELPDRNSPEDWPEAMLVTMDELHHILDERLRSLRQPEREGWMRLLRESRPYVVSAACDEDDMAVEHNRSELLAEIDAALQSEEK